MSAITGWGTALPQREVGNAEVARHLGTTAEWIVERSGIRTRWAASGPFADEEPPENGLGTTGRLAAEAGRQAIERAGLLPSQIDLVLVCTMTPDQAAPAVSAPIATALGIDGGAMDLNAACAGFAYGLITAAGLVGAGADRVLLIGAETLTRVTDWADRSSAFLFGDGAGAVVVESVPGPSSLLGWDAGVDGSLAGILYAEHGSGLVMHGQEVFRQAVRSTAASAAAAMDRAKVSADQIALFVPHQANSRIMQAVASRLGIAPDRVASVIDRTGNTSAASIPLALADAADRGRLSPGDLVLFTGFGAGLTWASAVWRWR